MGKGLLDKLKLGFATAGIMGLSYFNSLNAQTSEKDYQPKYNTIAHKMLMIEDSSDNVPFNTYPSLKTLDELIDNSKNYIPKKEIYTKEEIKEISEEIYLETEKKLHLNLFDLLNFLYSSTGGERGPCYKTTLCYLAIAEANNLPIYAVTIPNYRGHVFARYDLDGKHDPLNPNNPVNKGDINIETTTGEISETFDGKFSDSSYINEHKISKESLKKQTSLRALKNDQQLLSIAYFQRAVKHTEQKEYEKALEKEIEKCNEGARHPFYGYRIPKTRNEKEECLKNEKIKNYEELIKNGYEKALENCDKSLELDSNNVGPYMIKKYIYRKMAIKQDIKSGEYDLWSEEHDKYGDKADEYYKRYREYQKKVNDLLGIEEK